MPHFLIKEFKHVASRNEPDISLPVLEDGSPAPKISIREFSCQTESIPENQEKFKRKDSAIDVDEADSRIVNDCNNGTQITLEKIAAGLFDYPRNGQVSQALIPAQIPHLNAYSDLDKETETFHKDPKSVRFMEQKLSEFQDYKKRHQKNLERLRFVQRDIDSVLKNPECSPHLLKLKIKEIESLQKDITVYNQTNDSRKREIIDLSQQILFLIQQTR
jgi:DNA repair ATPase RecN